MYIVFSSLMFLGDFRQSYQLLEAFMRPVPSELWHVSSVKLIIVFCTICRLLFRLGHTQLCKLSAVDYSQIGNVQKVTSM